MCASVLHTLATALAHLTNRNKSVYVSEQIRGYTSATVAYFQSCVVYGLFSVPNKTSNNCLPSALESYIGDRMLGASNQFTV